jgi:hypothetical protein
VADQAPPEDETSGADAFVDPSEWLGEFLADDSRESPTTEDAQTPAVNTVNTSSNVEKLERGKKGKHDAHPELLAARERGETTGAAPTSPYTPDVDTADPLANLADPGNESAEPSGAPTPRRGPAPRADSPPTGLPILTVASGPGAGKKLPLLPVTMTLGREVDNNIELKDKDVARYHARISYESGKYVIQDLEGSSGTFVNGQKVTKAALAPGDVIRVGSTELTLDMA